MATKRPVRYYDVAVQLEGRIHTGRWHTVGECMTVQCGLGSKSMPIGKVTPQMLAQTLLLDIVKGNGHV